MQCHQVRASLGTCLPSRLPDDDLHEGDQLIST